MASPLADSYSPHSSGLIYGGLFAPSANVTTALVGDSITARDMGLTNFYWMNALTGGKLTAVANIGITGNTIQQVLDRIDNAYTPGTSTMGIGDLPRLGYITCRIGTNDLFAGRTIADVQAIYTALFAKLAGYADNVWILAVPPYNAETVNYNNWLSAYCAANPGKFFFVDDCTTIRDGSNVKIPEMFADSLHPSYRGVYYMGVAGAAIITSRMAVLPNPLPPSSNLEWFTNPTMSGTGGGMSGPAITGVVPNQMYVGAYGDWLGAASVVAADGGDPIQIPWLRVTPNKGAGGGNGIKINGGGSLRAITANDPGSLDVITQIRFNNFKSEYFYKISRQVPIGSFGKGSPDASLVSPGDVILNSTVVLRHKLPREGTWNSGDTMGFELFLIGVTNYGPGLDVGSMDVRCISIRG